MNRSSLSDNQLIQNEDTTNPGPTGNTALSPEGSAWDIEPEIFYSIENTEDIDINLQLTFPIKLRPGYKVNVIVEPMDLEKKGTEGFWRFPQTEIEDETTPARKNFKEPKYRKWIQSTQAHIFFLQNINSVLKARLANTQQELGEVTAKMDKKNLLLKYGFIPYLIYLIVSLAIFCTFGAMYVIWRIKNVYIYNPTELFITSVMALGWSLTAIGGLYSVKKRIEE